MIIALAILGSALLIFMIAILVVSSRATSRDSASATTKHGSDGGMGYLAATDGTSSPSPHDIPGDSDKDLGVELEDGEIGGGSDDGSDGGGGDGGDGGGGGGD
jgi:hypothetical protein